TRWLGIVVATLRSCLRTHRELALENLALRQQLAVCKARQPRPGLTETDRIFWALRFISQTDWRAISRLFRHCSPNRVTPHFDEATVEVDLTPLEAQQFSESHARP